MLLLTLFFPVVLLTIVTYIFSVMMYVVEEIQRC